jgi:hypothetical protein
MTTRSASSDDHHVYQVQLSDLDDCDLQARAERLRNAGDMLATIGAWFKFDDDGNAERSFDGLYTVHAPAGSSCEELHALFIRQGITVLYFYNMPGDGFKPDQAQIEEDPRVNWLPSLYA